MASSDSLENHFRDQLAPLGDVSARRMFGAACLFKGGAAFAIVDDGTLFLKADESMKAEMRPGGGRPFTYAHKTRGAVEMSYSTPPDSAFDDVDELLGWARRSVALATARQVTRKQKSPKKSAAQAKKTATTKKTATKKTATKKTATKKTAAKKTASKKTASKKTASKKTASKETASKKAASKKKAAKQR